MKKDVKTPVQYLKGVGPAVAQLLARLNVHTVEDLLFFFPREYEDRRKIKKVRDLIPGEDGLIVGRITGLISTRAKRGVNLLKAEVDDGTGRVRGVWFNQPFLSRRFLPGKEILLAGKVDYHPYARAVEMTVRNYEILNGDRELALGRLLPLYSLTEGLYQKKIRRLAARAVEEFLENLEEIIPENIKQACCLYDRRQAVREMHFPSSPENQREARRRLAFDEFFIFQLGLALRRRHFSQELPGIAFAADSIRLGKFLDNLPFTLTAAQAKVIEEIKNDMASARPMSRLVQGDVGSGKTVVAVAAALVAVDNGYQAAIMVPTEILAQQHYLKLKGLLEPLGVRLGMLISGRPAAEKTEVATAVAEGDIDIVVGTHALIQEGVSFKKLGLAVIDEQHRFGVLQRQTLQQKGSFPDLLVMTATPIPRTLALTLYGDLARSIITELPPGRNPIKTYLCREADLPKVYQAISKIVAAGRQAFIVCPLVEESEVLDLKAATELYEILKQNVFPELRLGLIHGRLPGEEKDRLMRRFKEGEIDILVSTTVIEVGIDIPNATVMLIQHAERFGLSQLHQLRGRIGRGADQAHCFLVGNPKTIEARRRLQAMRESQDGFHLAEVDLKIRGPGEFYGVRQSGLPVFAVADIIKDELILREARQAAFRTVGEDPHLESSENAVVRRQLWERYREFLELGALN